MWPVLIAAWIVPSKQRAEWRARRTARHDAYRILVDRGEIISDSRDEAMLTRQTIADAIAMRVHPAALAEWLQSPAFLAQAALALFAFVTLASHGLAGTRHLVDVLFTVDLHTADPRQNTLIAHGIPMLFALFMGSILAGNGSWPGGGHGWRYWTFLIGKTLAAISLVTLTWIETVRFMHPTYNNPLSVLPVLLFTLLYVVTFGFAVQWSLSDQRARCPVCLNRLAMPVSMGSWASILEPARTELVCAEGHGSLAITEADTAEADRWTTMDGSWKELFEHKTVGR